MKKILFLFLLGSIIGCSTVQIPSYVKDEKSFEERFYANHDRVKSAVSQALTDMGWVVDRELDPNIFEMNPGYEDYEEGVLLITKVRRTWMLVTSRYIRMNVYIFSNNDVSQVEMRYLAINDMFFFKPRSYGSENMAERLFSLVKKYLGES